MAAMKIRVLIADDHPIVRQGVAALLGSRPDLAAVGQASDGAGALSLYEGLQPDVVLADLRMPKMGGVEMTRRLREKHPDARVVVLTTFDGDEEIYQALRAGAKAYLLKDCEPEMLVETIRSVHAGKKCLAPAVAAKLAERVEGPELTGREREVLRLMVDGKSNRDIGKILYVTEGTVKVHVSNILWKLNASSRSEAISTTLKRGILAI